MRRIIIVLVALLLMAGCDQPEASVDENRVAANPSPSATPTRVLPTATPTPTETPTATPTPSPTPTPTPTAQPISVSDSLRSRQAVDPESQSGAPCGYVDYFDFPVNPPDALSVARGGGDFGVYRSRYELYHAGEDWWPRRGESSFGVPVFAIGHGQVTLAAPDGWGRDKGVVVIEHRFPDGERLLSFYGHLDPPSVTLKAGTCVRRGEQVGDIGRPRSTPHLHFEVRTHLPYETGTGYWFEDPTLAGWRSPSDTIWYSRVATAPGVMWARRPIEPDLVVLGTLADEALLATVDERLVAVSWADGQTIWQDGSDKRRARAVMDAHRPVAYVSDRSGFIEALDLDFLLAASDEQGLAEVEPLWRSSSRYSSSSTLMPLPGGGLVVASWNQTTALSADGRLLWEGEPLGRSFDWVLTEEMLIVSKGNGEAAIWSLDESGIERWPASVGGPLAGAQGQVYVYGHEGVYELNLERHTTRLLYALSPRFLSGGDLLVLPDGALLVAHADMYDQRLLVVEPDGALRWERSIAWAIDGDASLLADGRRAYLIAWERQDSVRTLSLYDVAAQSAELTLLFKSGRRSSLRPGGSAWIGPSGNLLLEMGDGRPVALDLRRALEIAAAD